MAFIRISDIDNERFFKLPKMLFLNPKYKGLSTIAKVAYGMIRDRMEISKRHGWVDPDGKVYVYFKQSTLAEFLSVTERSIRSIFNELKEAGLLETKKQGMCQPSKIYLMKVDTCLDEEPDITTEVEDLADGQEESFLSDRKNFPHGQEENFRTDRKQTSVRIGSRLPPNETEYSETEISETNKDDDDRDKGWQDVLKAYQNNINPAMGEWELEKLQDLFDDFKETWVIEAIKAAVERNARNLRYITVTLEQWQRDGFKVDNRKKHQSSRKKTNSYSQDDYEKVLAELERKDGNARES